MEAKFRAKHEDLNDNSKTIITSALYLIMFAYGFSITLIGPLMPVLIQQYHLRFSQGGLILTFQSAGGLLAMALGVVIVDMMKKSRLILAALVLYSLSLLLISFTSLYMVLLGLFFALGAGTKMIDIVINAYISDIHPDKRDSRLNFLHACFGFGAFAGPLFSTAILNKDMQWNNIFLIFGIICTTIAVCYLIILKVTRTQEKKKDMIKSGYNFKIFTDKKIILLCLVMFLYAGHQSGATTWVPTLVEKTLEANIVISGLALSVFWLGITLGRIVCALISRKVKPKYLILIGSLLGGLFLIAGLNADGPLVFTIALGITGFFTGAIIPLVITTACESYPDNSGTVSSLIMLVGSLAWMVFPWLVGVTSEIYDFKLGMSITGIVLLLIVAIIPLISSRADLSSTKESAANELQH